LKSKKEILIGDDWLNKC